MVVIYACMHLFIANRKGRYEHQNVIAFVFIGYIFACTTSVSSFPYTSVHRVFDITAVKCRTA